MQRTTKLTMALTIIGLLGPARALAAPETQVDVLAAYAIDGDTFQLVRYAFVTNTFQVIGTVRTASGTVAKDCESLGYIGQGPAKGMYSVPTSAPFERQLIKIDPLTAIATVFAPTVVPSGRKVTGMTQLFDSVAGEWYLLAASSVKQTSGRDLIETRELIRINPLTGVSSVVATQAQLGDGRRFEGLGVDSNGNIWATARTRFYRIHQEAGYWVQEVGITGLDKAEAFEIAFGDYQASITVPGVPPSWTTTGVFFVADEQIQKFGVINPANGAFVEYMVNGAPSAFVTKDAEGMILLTLSRDPLYGALVTSD